MNKRLKTVFFFGLGIGAIAWTAGFFRFVERVGRPPLYPDSETQAIVALTGGVDRIPAAIALLKQNDKTKLLISGVNQTVDWSKLAATVEELPQEIADRVTLGFIACDTRQNALEARQFMEKNGMTSLRLVTASYHMPRSLSEFRYAMPDALIVPHPVFPEQFKVGQWWKFKGTTWLLLSEYSKFLVASLRHALPFSNKTLEEKMCEK